MSETQKRCLNCGFRDKAGLGGSFSIQNVTVGTLELEEKHLLQRWIPYLEVCDTHWICAACARQVRSAQADTDANTEGGPPRRYGHGAVCVSCGGSVLGKGSTLLDSVHAQHFRDAALKDLPDYLKGIPFEKICKKCTPRYRTGLTIGTQKTDTQHEMYLLQEGASSNLVSEAGADDDYKTKASAQRMAVERIRLDEYKRVKGGDGCLGGRGGAACGGAVRGAALRRRQAAAARGVYLPHSVRLCRTHRAHPPPTAVQCGHLFTGEEIADLLFLLKCVPSFAEGRADPHWCRAWLGVPPAALRSAARRLRAAAAHRDDVTDPATAAAAYFLMNRQAECHTVLASLLECEPGQVAGLARIAAECLDTPHNGEEVHKSGSCGSDDLGVNAVFDDIDAIIDPFAIEELS